MSSDQKNWFGFQNLNWVKHVATQFQEILHPFRLKERDLNKEILNLQHQLDLKRADLKKLHLEAILASRRNGLSKSDMEKAIKIEEMSGKTLKGFPKAPNLQFADELEEVHISSNDARSSERQTIGKIRPFSSVLEGEVKRSKLDNR